MSPTAAVEKLLKRSARFQHKIEKTLLKLDHNADILKLNELMDKVDAEIQRVAGIYRPTRRKRAVKLSRVPVNG